MNFAQRLNELMESRKLTAYRVSKDTGLSDSLIGYYRSGKNEPSLENLSKLAEYFKVSTGYLLGQSRLIVLKDTPYFEKTGKTIEDVIGLDEEIHKLLNIVSEEEHISLSEQGALFIEYSLIEYLENADKESHTKTENCISGDVVGSAFVQGVNNGSVIGTSNGASIPLSPEAKELLRVFEGLGVKSRMKLLNTAFELEEDKGGNA